MGGKVGGGGQLTGIEMDEIGGCDEYKHCLQVQVEDSPMPNAEASSAGRGRTQYQDGRVAH